MNPYALLDPAVSALNQLIRLLANALPWPGGGAGVAVALILVTLGVRACLLPVSLHRLRLQRAQLTLAPRLAELRVRHAGDPQRLLSETSRTYREAGVSPVAGLLPALVQLPVLATVYRLVIVPSVAGTPNVVLAAHLFGAPLAAHWPEVVAAGGLLGAGGLGLALLLLALIAVAVVSSQEIVRRAGETADPAADPATGAGTKTMIKVLRMLPFATVVFAVFSPVAMGLYLLASTAWTVGEQRLLPRLLPAGA